MGALGLIALILVSQAPNTVLDTFQDLSRRGDSKTQSPPPSTKTGAKASQGTGKSGQYDGPQIQARPSIEATQPIQNRESIQPRQ